MAFSSPYQGAVCFEEVNGVCERFVKLGADEVVIGDTNGQADPKMVYGRFSRLRKFFPHTVFVGHFHDTRKMALANVLAAMQAGITKFDSAVGGLGGCPYSPGATGNVATEELALMLSSMGCDIGFDDQGIQEVSRFARTLCSR